ncbi:Ran-binding protein 17 [Saguinus oedipus]|uniref:Ran-binding protein 17 n=1 Tax=Saguinus oedipus TaxID=9490 RepID=A0ABQ9WB81_SAGOE|nr:Ran-binding protein 17 [Saguinus oedipus]
MAGEDEDEFENFMLPLTVAFETVLQIFNNNFKQEDVKRMLIGLARDLRGIAFALNTKTSYTMLFDWMYPYYTATIPALCTEGCQAPRFLSTKSQEESNWQYHFRQTEIERKVQLKIHCSAITSVRSMLELNAVERWYGEPACTTPILKLMAELMQNRSQRLNFDVSSPNGILLFREVSKMVCTYGEIAAKTEQNNSVRIILEEEEATEREENEGIGELNVIQAAVTCHHLDNRLLVFMLGFAEL